MPSKNMSIVIRTMFDNRIKTEMVLEEVKKKDSRIILLQHDKKTGDMAYIQKHPKSHDHVIYSNSLEGQRSDVILHRKHVEEMIKLLNPEKEKKDDKK
jgi:hypothetical protein